jgi:antirestriction protein ArdC
MRPWSAEHAAGRITRPLRHNGVPYKGINVVMLWSASVVNGYSCPLWLTFKQALELGGNVRKGEHGELVVYANRITRTETNETGEETEREIPFLKGYTVFNAEPCEGLPAQYSAKAELPALPPAARIERADQFSARHVPISAMAEPAPITPKARITFRCRPSRPFAMPRAMPPRWRMNSPIGTKHEKRLARDMGRIRWGDGGYAKEELVAEPLLKRHDPPINGRSRDR